MCKANPFHNGHVKYTFDETQSIDSVRDHSPCTGTSRLYVPPIPHRRL
jgi:hypothetical protein